ncbi:MAG: YqaE/Pmp3 family membrane protein [Flavobacteriales bacterium]
MKKILFFSMSALFLIASCTVEKRIYRNGFNVQWHAMNGISKKDKNVMDEMPSEEVFVAQTIVSPKSKVQVADVYTTASTEVTTDNTADVASISNQPLILDVKKDEVSGVKGMAAQTIQNHHKELKKGSVAKQVMKAISTSKKQSQKSNDVPVGLLYVLCFFIPFVAVGIVTDWDITTVLINVLWTALCGIPGIIHAIIVVNRNV